MDDSELADLINSTVKSSTQLIALQRNSIKEYQSIIDSLVQGVQGLTSAMDEQAKGRTGRIRLSILVGACAIVVGVFVLWDSSSIRSGFLQTLLVALGGALITFCLVELILNKIVEIPTKEAKSNAEQVNRLKSLNAELAHRTQVVRESTRETDAEVDEQVRKMKDIASF